MDASQKMQAAREHLLVDQRFFGTMICNMKIVPATRVRGQAINTMATDGFTIWYNPGFVDGLTLAETIGVLMHEVLHKANAHHLRRGGRGGRMWNKACDYAINPIILAAKHVLPEGGLINKAFANWSAEEIYERLMLDEGKGSESKVGLSVPSKGDKKEKSDEHEGDADGDDGDPDAAAGDDDQEASAPDDGGCGDGEEEAPDGERQEAEQEDGGDEDGEKPNTHSDEGLILDPLNDEGQQMSEAEMQEAADALRVEIIQAVNIATSAGDMPAGMERLVEDAKNPRPDWREMLLRFVSQAVQTPVDQTWARPNRRFIHQGMYLPGWRKEGTNDLLMVIDSSGSTITTPALPRFYVEMKRILADTQPDSVTVMWCDSRVQKVETYTDPSEIPQICPGGGGTMFSPVWRKVQEMGIKPAGCVFFTDLICSDYGEEPDFPVLWAKWGKANRKPPFGEVLDINQP